VLEESLDAVVEFRNNFKCRTSFKKRCRDLVDQAEIHRKALNRNRTERVDAVRQFRDNFAALPDTSQAWQDLHRLTSDKDWGVRREAAGAIGSAFSQVPGATGLLDTNYEGKVEAALGALERLDFVYLHVEAPDEMGHDGSLEKKIEAIRRFDARIVGPILEGLEKSGHEWHVLVLPDHPTPVTMRTHTSEPVPFAMMGASIEPDEMEVFTEQEGARGGYGKVDGWRLMGEMMRG